MIPLQKFLVNNRVKNTQGNKNYLSFSELKPRDIVHIRAHWKDKITDKYIEGFGQIVAKEKILTDDGFLRWSNYAIYNDDGETANLIKGNPSDIRTGWLVPECITDYELYYASDDEVAVIEDMTHHEKKFYDKIGVYNLKTGEIQYD